MTEHFGVLSVVTFVMRNCVVLCVCAITPLSVSDLLHMPPLPDNLKNNEFIHPNTAGWNVENVRIVKPGRPTNKYIK